MTMGRWNGVMNGNNRGESGFSLLEVLLALILAGTTTAVLAFSYQQAVHLQKSVEGRVTAAVLGGSKLAELQEGSEPLDAGVFPVPYQRYRWAAREEADGNGRELIVLTVQWGDGNGATYQREFKAYRRLR